MTTDDGPKGTQPVTVLLAEEARNGGHTRIKVRVGRGRHSRALSGTLVLRNDEWDELLTCGMADLGDRVEVTADRIDTDLTDADLADPHA